MHPDDVMKLGRQLMGAHGLKGWTLGFDNARQRCGSCRFSKKEITLSKHFVSLNGFAEIQATLLHEIAHALAGPGAGHGRHWRDIATRIGARAESTNDSAVMPQAPWGIGCMNCGQIVARRFRRSLEIARARCKACGVELGVLRWIRLQSEENSRTGAY